MPLLQLTDNLRYWKTPKARISKVLRKFRSIQQKREQSNSITTDPCGTLDCVDSEDTLKIT